MAAVIEVQDLKKSYGKVEAVKGISFSVQEGEIFGFLGPNGAGKTTTIQILATLLEPTSGSARVAGYDVLKSRDRVRESIGLVFQDPTLDAQLTAMENLTFHGLLYGLPSAEVKRRAVPLLEMVGLSDRAKSLVKTFSGGMKRRLELVRGLIHTPKVLFLDEPTVGLDPQSRAQMWNHILSLSKETDVSIFVTTHYMEEAEYASRIAIMDHGEIVALDTPNGLKRRVADEVIVLEASSLPANADWAKDLGVNVLGDIPKLEIHAKDAAAVMPKVVEAFGTRLRRMEVRRPTLDTVFLEITGREIRDETVSPKDFTRGWMGRMVNR